MCHRNTRILKVVRKSYRESINKSIAPCMVQLKFKATGWMGLLTAGKFWMDFKNLDNFDNSTKSLIKVLTAVCGDG